MSRSWLGDQEITPGTKLQLSQLETHCCIIIYSSLLSLVSRSSTLIFVVYSQSCLFFSISPCWCLLPHPLSSLSTSLGWAFRVSVRLLSGWDLRFLEFCRHLQLIVLHLVGMGILYKAKKKKIWNLLGKKSNCSHNSRLNWDFGIHRSFFPLIPTSNIWLRRGLEYKFPSLEIGINI